MLVKEVNLNHIISNLNYIKASTRKDIIPVVKSNAYSHGVKEVVKKLFENGTNLVAVNDLNEAIEIAKDYSFIDILIFNSVDINDFSKLCLYNNIILSINSLSDIKNICEYCYLKRIRVHLQIDTGMNRFGIKSLKEYREIIDIIKDNEVFNIEGIYTHFTSQKMYEVQLNKFKEFLNIFSQGIIHASASSTYSKESIGSLRIGLDLYGDGSNKNLLQAVSIITKPIAIHKLAIGETLGYNEKYKATEPITVATLPVGYYDGYKRNLTGFHVYANGNYYEVIGVVCMNHIFVRVDENIDLNTEFELLGNNISVYEMAKYLNTIPGDILCGFKVKNINYKS